MNSFEDELNSYYKRVEGIINNAINKNDVVINGECDISVVERSAWGLHRSRLARTATWRHDRNRYR